MAIASSHLTSVVWALLVCLSQVAASPLEGQTSGAPTSAGAREALAVFERAIADSDLDRAAAVLDLEGIPPGLRAQVGQRLALQLALVMERIPPVSDGALASLGDEVILAETPGGDVALAKTKLADGTSEWRISRRTVEATPRIFRAVIGRPILTPSEALAASGQANVPIIQWQAPEVALWVHMPRALKFGILGLEAYQWIGIPLVAACAWLLAKIAASLAIRLLRRVVASRPVAAQGSATDPWVPVMRAVIRTTALALGLQFAAWLVLLLGLPVDVMDLVLSGLQVATTGAVVWLGLDAVDFAALWVSTKEHDGNLRALDDLLVKSASRVAKIVVVVAGLVAVVSMLGAESAVDRLLAGLGIGGLAFALAAQEPLKNFFSSIVIASDRLFTVGDRVTFDGVTGVVQDVGFRVTTLRTKVGSSLIVPNATLASARIEKQPKEGELKEFKSMMLLRPDITPAQLDGLRSGVLRFLKECEWAKPSSAEVGVRAVTQDGVEFSVSVLLPKSIRSVDPDSINYEHRVGTGILAVAAAQGILLQVRS